MEYYTETIPATLVENITKEEFSKMNRFQKWGHIIAETNHRHLFNIIDTITAGERKELLSVVNDVKRIISLYEEWIKMCNK